MRKIIAGASLGFALTAGAVTAADESPKGSPDEVVCKQEKKVNSRFTTKSCFTRAQWAERAERDKRELGENQSRHKIFVPMDK